MPTRIKNCGLTTTESIDQAIATGASYVGFVHHAASPRHVEIEAMATLAAHARKKVQSVAVLVNPSPSLLDEIAARVKPDFFQLHQVADSSRLQQIYQQHRIPIISAISVRSASDLTLALTLEEISEHLLFDAMKPGGGKPFNWQLLKNLPLKKKWFLAGGLTSENVGEALRLTHAPIVDVSSGIESAPGIKSLEKIAAFNAAVLNAGA